MANEWAEQKLPTGTDGKERPAIWDTEKEEWIVPRGRDGRQWVRDDRSESVLKDIRESMGDSEKVLEKLEDMNDRLKKIENGDTEISTKVTGSNVEQKKVILDEEVAINDTSDYTVDFDATEYKSIIILLKNSLKKDDTHVKISKMQISGLKKRGTQYFWLEEEQKWESHVEFLFKEMDTSALVNINTLPKLDDLIRDIVNGEHSMRVSVSESPDEGSLEIKIIGVK